MKLIETALGDLQRSLNYASAKILQLEQEVSVSRGGHIPVPESLIVISKSGSRTIGFNKATAPNVGYKGFEDIFRGSEDVIRERLQFYLPFLVNHEPVIEMGSGRGEMLELLRDAGVYGRGVDSDPSMVSRATEKGLEVEEADALQFISALKDRSVGAVFSAQFIEHLSYRDILTVMDESVRILPTDGVFVAETVNPHCALARKNFWLDLSHQRPIFPEVAVVLCHQAGFGEAHVVFPGGSGELDTDLLTCPDYAVIAVR
ncbi:MAG: class I SAM-dependent methyltransferase [Actinobacteria bacterium]|nr:class I SAM-dependent methyltransferase [Actinomycetota bacterium]